MHGGIRSYWINPSTIERPYVYTCNACSFLVTGNFRKYLVGDLDLRGARCELCHRIATVEKLVVPEELPVGMDSMDYTALCLLAGRLCRVSVSIANVPISIEHRMLTLDDNHIACRVHNEELERAQA